MFSYTWDFITFNMVLNPDLSIFNKSWCFVPIQRAYQSQILVTSRFPPVVDRVKCKEKENKYRFTRR